MGRDLYIDGVECAEDNNYGARWHNSNLSSEMKFTKSEWSNLLRVCAKIFWFPQDIKEFSAAIGCMSRILKDHFSDTVPNPYTLEYNDMDEKIRKNIHIKMGISESDDMIDLLGYLIEMNDVCDDNSANTRKEYLRQEYLIQYHQGLPQFQDMVYATKEKFADDIYDMIVMHDIEKKFIDAVNELATQYEAESDTLETILVEYS